MGNLNIDSFKSEPRETPEGIRELDRLRNHGVEEIKNNPSILEYFSKEWLEEGITSLSFLIENNNPVINLIVKGSISFVIKTLSQLREKKVLGFNDQLSRLITKKDKQEIWAEIEAASLLSRVSEVEFFERLHSGNMKVPDLRCQKNFTYYVEVYLPKQNEELSSLEKTELQSGKRVVEVMYTANKWPYEYLHERIRKKYQQFENYNPGIIYADFTFAGHFLGSVDSLKTALTKIFKKKLINSTTLGRHLLGMFCTNIFGKKERYFFYDNEDERSVKLNAELLELFEEKIQI